MNKFLIAKPGMPDPRFQETVIFILYHNPEGAAGLVLNKPLKTMSINRLFEISNLKPPKNIQKKEITLYWGGPVEQEKVFFIHSSDYKSENIIMSNKDFILTDASEVLYDIAINKGPKNYLILTGISVWRPGQLDFEMQQGDWNKKTNSYVPLFNNDNTMWHRLINSKEI